MIEVKVLGWRSPNVARLESKGTLHQIFSLGRDPPTHRCQCLRQVAQGRHVLRSSIKSPPIQGHGRGRAVVLAVAAPSGLLQHPRVIAEGVCIVGRQHCSSLVHASNYVIRTTLGLQERAIVIENITAGGLKRQRLAVHVLCIS